MIQVALELQGIEGAVDELLNGMMPSLELFYHKVGAEVVKQLRSYISESRPPVKKGGPLRPAHLGHWGDITHDLEKAYRYEVHRSGLGLELAIINDDPGGYGAILDKRATFFVLRGIDAPGGLIDVVTMVALSLSPDWKAG